MADLGILYKKSAQVEEKYQLTISTVSLGLVVQALSLITYRRSTLKAFLGGHYKKSAQFEGKIISINDLYSSISLGCQSLSLITYRHTTFLGLLY